MSFIEDIPNMNKKTKKIILISTIEVYGKDNNKNEINKTSKRTNSSYGINRVFLEEFIKKFFTNHLIIRLPIVYGKNFIKNCIYDLKNKNNVNKNLLKIVFII